MQKFLTGTAWCRKRPIHYYLLAEGESCGVEVEYQGEEAAVCAVGSRQRTEGLLRRLQTGRVTPVAVLDVIEDWLLDSSCNFSTDSV